jgi:flavin reductase (DIM6/NTAB) family NADH-FMN oxidoreductase RutF
MQDRTFALRMIPYGVFVATAIDPATQAAAACTVHWVTQTSFAPPLLAMSVLHTHPVLELIRVSGRFALHMLGKEDKAEAITFARAPTPSTRLLKGSLSDGGATLGGYNVSWGRRGTLLLHSAVAVLECEMRAVLEAGDHHPVIAEVVETHLRLPQHSRPDEMILHLRELGPRFFHGG